MTTKDYLTFLVEEIHSTVAATVDENGLPVTCVIDMMYCDADGLYFLTAKGKNFYRRLKAQQYLALSGMKGADTMSSIAVSVRGNVKEIGAAMLPLLLQKNPYMYEIYPSAESRAALTVFQLYQGSGVWFDLSKKPVERATFTFGGAADEDGGYIVGKNCTGCGICASVCPQNCIAFPEGHAVIHQNNCLHCGNCAEVCPSNAIARR